MFVLLGLGVAACFGSGDFLGGVASKRVSTLMVLVIVQSTGLVVAIAYATAFGGSPHGRDLAFGAVAGALNVVALGALYRGLATGRIGVVAPVTAVVGSLIPVGWGLARGERPSGLALAGAAIAIVAGALIAREHIESVGATGRELVYAAAAGTGFGASFVLYAKTGKHSGFWPVLSGRVAALLVAVVVVVAAGARRRPAPRESGLAIGAGVLDVSATALLLLAVRRGLASLVAPLAALGPAFTVGLAWFVLRERVVRTQVLGLVLALVGLALIATG